MLAGVGLASCLAFITFTWTRNSATYRASNGGMSQGISGIPHITSTKSTPSATGRSGKSGSGRRHLANPVSTRLTPALFLIGPSNRLKTNSHSKLSPVCPGTLLIAPTWLVGCLRTSIVTVGVSSREPRRSAALRGRTRKMQSTLRVHSGWRWQILDELHWELHRKFLQPCRHAPARH